MYSFFHPNDSNQLICGIAVKAGAFKLIDAIRDNCGDRLVFKQNTSACVLYSRG